jgi:hypothetical protein
MGIRISDPSSATAAENNRRASFVRCFRPRRIDGRRLCGRKKMKHAAFGQGFTRRSRHEDRQGQG